MRCREGLPAICLVGLAALLSLQGRRCQVAELPAPDRSLENARLLALRPIERPEALDGHAEGDRVSPRLYGWPRALGCRETSVAGVTSRVAASQVLDFSVALLLDLPPSDAASW
jgi:hypothetical protein